MKIDPFEIHAGVLLRDPIAEKELAAFLKHVYGPDYRITFGPLAEDHLQELTWKVVEGIRRNVVEHPHFLVTYCQTTAANLRIDALRSLGRDLRRLVPIDETRPPRSRQSIEDDLISAEQFRIVLKLIETLKPLGREIVQRFYFEHQSAKQIQAALGLTNEEFRGQKDRIVRKLRKDYVKRIRGWRVIPGGRPVEEMAA